MTEADRRQMQRFSLEVPALLSMMSESPAHEPLEVTTRDISSGGAFFITGKPLSMGTHVKMDLILSLKNNDESKRKKTHIDVSGAVVRTERNGMAVCFDKKYHISPLSG